MITDRATSARMSRTEGRDNAFERAIRSELHERGHRFRVHYPVPERTRRTIDIAFTRWRVAIFLDGCFWHGCPLHGTMPKRNAEFWTSKIQQNQERDAQTTLALVDAGWQVLRVWEHERPELVITRIQSVIERIRRDATVRKPIAAGRRRVMNPKQARSP